MKKENINKLLPAVAVFSFVAFAFAITNTFGNAYAVDNDYDIDMYYCDETDWEVQGVSGSYQCCPIGYTLSEDNETCSRSMYIESADQCPYGEGTANAFGNGYICTVNSYPAFEPIVEKHTAIFDATTNGGTGNTEKSCTPNNANPGTKCEITNVPSANKTGYTFRGWSKTPYCTSLVTNFEISNDTTYYACFETTKCNNNYQYDSTNSLCCPSGYVYLEGQCRGNTVDNSCPYGDKADDVIDGYECITPSLTPNNTTTTTKYTATFKPNGGTWADQTTTDKIIKDYTGRIYFTDERLVITAPDSTKEWCGWKNSDGEVWTEYIENENTTLTAQWCNKETTPEEPDTPTTTEYKITLNANGGTIGGKTTKDETCTTTSCEVKTVATKENSTFAGWSTTKDSCTSPTKTITLNKDTNGKTYYACYTQKSYEITFNLDDGKLYVSGTESSTTTVDLSEVDYSKYTAKKDGHTFKGWKKSGETCSNAVATGKLTVTSDMTLTACYTEDEKETPKYKVTFSVDGGKLFVDKKESTSLTIALEEVDYSKYTAEKDGHKFLGWSNVKGSCDTPVKEGKVEIKEDTSIKACYEKVEDKEDEKEEEKPTTDKTEEEVDKTPQTGSTILYLVFLMAILSLVYTGYYSYRYIKSRM